jgi:8-oxo-dGTP pyrophosphatase MutT (NUDIX family)
MYGQELMTFDPERSCMITSDNSTNSKSAMRKVTECGVILLNQDMNDILIVFQNKSQKWGFPKGHMTRLEMYNKEYFKCAKRELLEETGIDLRTLSHTKYGSVIIGNKLFFIIEGKRRFIYTNPLDICEIEMVQWIKRKDLNAFVISNNCNVTLNKLF